MTALTSDRPLEGQTALVTGASSGIGAETAKLLSAAGARLFLVARSQDRLERTRTELAAADGVAPVVIAEDLVESRAENRIAERVRESGDGLDLLIHSAGIYRRAPFAETSLADLDAQWRINAWAPYALTQTLLPNLRPGARVVFVSSVAASTPMPDRSAYCATKAALEMMMRCLARELAPHSIRVNAVAPGFIATPMNEALRTDPGFVSRIESLTPAGRLGLPEEVAAAVLFLVTPDSDFIHGETLAVSGGYPTSL